MKENGRRNYIDAAKGIAVLLVIFGHTFRESMRAEFRWCDLSYVFVYRFHVSLLFILSGMAYTLTKQKNNNLTKLQYLKKKSGSLLLPWISYSVFVYVVFAMAQMIPLCRQILESSSYHFLKPIDYIVLMLRNENPYSFHIWYLQTLFLFSCVTFLIDRQVAKQRNVMLIKIALILILPAFYEFFCGHWVWTWKGFFQKYLFFLLGTILSETFLQKKAKILLGTGLFSGVYLVFLLFFPLTQWYKKPYIGLVLCYIENAAIVGLCLGILAVCVLLEEHLKCLAEFGRHSLTYYLYHQPFCCALLGLLLYNKLHLSVYATVGACMIASFVVPHMILKIFGRGKIGIALRKVGLLA